MRKGIAIKILFELFIFVVALIVVGIFAMYPNEVWKGFQKWLSRFGEGAVSGPKATDLMDAITCSQMMCNDGCSEVKKEGSDRCKELCGSKTEKICGESEKITVSTTENSWLVTSDIPTATCLNIEFDDCKGEYIYRAVYVKKSEVLEDSGSSVCAQHKAGVGTAEIKKGTYSVWTRKYETVGISWIGGQTVVCSGGGGIPWKGTGTTGDGESGQCSDTDEGRDETIKGTCKGTNGERVDSCDSAGRKLAEWHCAKDGSCAQDIIDCKTYGKKCSDGACV